MGKLSEKVEDFVLFFSYIKWKFTEIWTHYRVSIDIVPCMVAIEPSTFPVLLTIFDILVFLNHEIVNE